MNKKVFTGFVIASAIIYIIISYNMLFSFRHVGFGNFSLSERIQGGIWQGRYNLVPFKTIGNYLSNLFRGNMDAYFIRATIMDLIGNLLILMPLGFYLPFFVNKAAKAHIFVIVVAALIIIIEATQFVTPGGRVLDIDDFILNLVGALIGFFICKHTPIRSLFKYRAY